MVKNWGQKKNKNGKTVSIREFLSYIIGIQLPTFQKTVIINTFQKRLKKAKKSIKVGRKNIR